MKIAIHGKNFTQETVPFIHEVFNELMNRGAELILSERFHQMLGNISTKGESFSIYHRKEDLKKVDFFLSLGGDGTLLETLTHIGALEIPVLGINMGRLGFLATISKNKIKEAIHALFTQSYSIEKRTLINLASDKDIFEGKNFGLNEFTILKQDSSSMIVVHTYIDGDYLNSYWADGLIVSTPTGSTGYSLSCGGPVVLPQSNNFIITPVSPHNLSIRPLIVSDSSVISFEVEGRSRHFLISLDSRSRTVETSFRMSVKKETFFANLVKINGNDYLGTLREKLNWGFDIRN
ncbi:NAD kinase [Xanthovirga aplysinae]|uniref:NAD kinase n=1 Tax=Xanthovirga aplysinae TaxID=2529853 RepID=UPI0012BD5C3B|nr:NAD kinase [Xanthovirga aplysinae]MTI31309.1 NAD kinase [Xanthovirga aplysinae]